MLNNFMSSRKVFNLERDVKYTDWMVTKIRKNEIYAQNFYAALCNNQYQPEDVWGILSNIKWECSWMAAAKIVCEIRDDDNYHAWYCSGSGFSGVDFAGFVEESYVTEEVETDIKTVGWILITRRFLG